MPFQKTGTVIVGPVTIPNNEVMTWTHNLGAAAIKIELLNAENRVETITNLDVDQLDANTIIVDNTSGSTQIVTMWATFEVSSTSDAGSAPTGDPSIVVAP